VGRLVVDTYEEGDRKPIVRHVFTGRSRAEAEKIFRVHMKYDRFLRDCSRGGKFRARGGSLTCKVTRRWKAR